MNHLVTVPEGQSGIWRVERFTVSEKQAELENVRAIFGGGRRIQAGTYTRLMRGSTVVMSDTPAEVMDHYAMYRAAHGRILINGLGLGMVLQMCLDKPSVEHAMVVERSADVIALVAPHYQAKYGDRLTIVEADALTYQPPKGAQFYAVWHDIWDNICADNLPTMKTLHRKYGRRAGWQGSWCRAECERGR